MRVLPRRSTSWRISHLCSAVLTVLVVVLVASPSPVAASTGEASLGGPLLERPGQVVHRTAGVPPLPEVTAATWLVADASSGDVLAAKGAHVRRAPASTLKTLTALAVHPRLRRDEVYLAVHADAAVEGSRVGIVPDARYTVHQLFEGLFLNSGNDAAHALANAAGGVPRTVAEMNRIAAALGALDTRAVNPSGLDADGQLSSAYDLALLGQALLQEPELVGYASTVHADFPGKPAAPGTPRETFEIGTQQDFVRNYDGAIGLKNGYTTNARNTLIAAATRGDRTILVTLMGGPGGTWKEAAALADWGFRAAGTAPPVGRLVTPDEIAAARAAAAPAATSIRAGASSPAARSRSNARPQPEAAVPTAQSAATAQGSPTAPTDADAPVLAGGAAGGDAQPAVSHGEVATFAVAALGVTLVALRAPGLLRRRGRSAGAGPRERRQPPR